MGGRSRRLKLSLAIAVLALFMIGGVALATHNPGDSTGILNIGAPWGPADQDSPASVRVEVTYTLKAGNNIPSSTVQAVKDGISAWISAINIREASDSNDWDFDIVPFSDDNLPSGSWRGSPAFACHRGPDRPDGGGCDDNGGTTGAKPDIEIQLKKGGGLIAGSALSFFDGDGFRVKVKIQISGNSFGLPNSDATVQEITMHELGHALGLGHHSNENDLMGRTVGHENGSPFTLISECDLDGFEKSHHWLTADLTTTPHVEPVASIDCS